MKNLQSRTVGWLRQRQGDLRKAWQWARFGSIVKKVVSIDGGLASEIEYRGRGNLIVGYWAYGYFDPKMPFKG